MISREAMQGKRTVGNYLSFVAQSYNSGMGSPALVTSRLPPDDTDSGNRYRQLDMLQSCQQ